MAPSTGSSGSGAVPSNIPPWIGGAKDIFHVIRKRFKKALKFQKTTPPPSESVEPSNVAASYPPNGFARSVSDTQVSSLPWLSTHTCPKLQSERHHILITSFSAPIHARGWTL